MTKIRGLRPARCEASNNLGPEREGKFHDRERSRTVRACPVLERSPDDPCQPWAAVSGPASGSQRTRRAKDSRGTRRHFASGHTPPIPSPVSSGSFVPVVVTAQRVSVGCRTLINWMVSDIADHVAGSESSNDDYDCDSDSESSDDDYDYGSDAPDWNDSEALRLWEKRREERELRQRLTHSYCETCDHYRKREDVFWSNDPDSKGNFSKCVRCAGGTLDFCESCDNYSKDVEWFYGVKLPSWKHCESYNRSHPAMVMSFCQDCKVTQNVQYSLRILGAFRRAYAAGRIAWAVRSSAAFERFMKAVYAPGAAGHKRAIAELDTCLQ